MSAAIFNGAAVKLLKDILRLKSGVELITNDSDNPTLVAKNAPAGSIYIRNAAPYRAYIKKDAGLSTNWEPLVDNADLTSQLAAYIPLTEKAVANGVATLDAGGKIPASQLPNSIMEYLGTWDGSTNTPTLTNGTGNAGDVYITSVAGTQDFGSGPITFAVGDWVVYSGTVWQKSINSNAVVSVNGFTGVVVLDTDDVSEGSSLYFTDERAQDAVGGILTNSSTIDLNYDDILNTISATIVNDSITNAMINSSAAIAYSKLSLSNSIVNADISTSAAIAYSKLDLTNSIVNADISTSAAIAYSKLNLTNSIVNADISTSAAIAYSKLDLANSIVNADISTSAAIAYSKLALSNSIVDADISTTAAIDLSKLATLTADRALISNASGVVSVSSVTSTELGYVSGVTSSIQAQLDARRLSPQIANSRTTGLPVSASTVITPTVGQDLVQFITGNGGAVTVTATVPIEVTGMTVGQTVTLIGTSDTNTVTYQNGDSLRLNGSCVLGKDDSLTLMYVGTDGSNAAWSEVART